MNIPSLQVVAAVALLGVAACGEHSTNRASTDSALANDLALAGQQTAQPTFQDTAVAPAPIPAARARTTVPGRRPTREAPTTNAALAPRPRTTVPQPVAAPVPGPAPAAVRGEIGPGTAVALTSGTKVCTSTNLPGDKLVATVNEAVLGTNGAVIPAGANVVLEVASLTPGQTPDGAHVALRVRSIIVNDKTYTVGGDVVTVSPLQKTKVDGTDVNANKSKMIAGALAGALIGRLIGHNTKGTIIGAAAGAATGAAVAKSGERWEGCLPAGATLRLTLTAPMVMS